MPYYDFIWTDDVIRHLADHDVTPEDFEEAVRNPEDWAHSKSSGRPASLGRSLDGRLLICIYEFVDEITLLPFTAYEIEE